VKKAARDHITEKWQNRWNFSNRGRFYHNFHHQVKTKNLHDFPNKKISTVIYNLRSGYAKLNDYCHKLNITESANCQCGERETVEHYILHCDQYEEAREKLIHDMFLLSGSMHLSLEVLLKVGADEEVSLTEPERIRLLADYICRKPNASIYNLFIIFYRNYFIYFNFILYQCPPIKSTSVLKLPSVNCTCT
jgi:hypothetical protein